MHFCMDRSGGIRVNDLQDILAVIVYAMTKEALAEFHRL